MIYRAYSSDENRLLSLPETGMGYQIFEGQLTGSITIKKYVAYNSELIIELDDNFENYRKQMIELGYSNVLSYTNLLNIKTDSIHLVSKRSIFGYKQLSDFKIKSYSRQSTGKGAIDNPKENADGEEFFVRLSAFENDKRIDFDKKKLKDGTFTTTLIDYVYCVNFKDDPIDRYALPNNGPIKWAFYVRPKSVDRLQRGIVQPAFGHDGGGIEAYFENGTSENTYFVKKAYGELY